MMQNGIVLIEVEPGRRALLQIVNGSVITMECPKEFEVLPLGEYDYNMKLIQAAPPPDAEE
jgi:hypothetical protein